MSSLALSDVTFTGSRFRRPECVLTTRAGDLYSSDTRGGIYHLPAAGPARLYVGGSLDLPGPLHPNGFALDRDGSFVVAHLALDSGGIYRLDRAGQLTPLLQQLDGVDLTATNFVLLDHHGRLWITVSTRQHPRTKAFNPAVTDGYIVRLDHRGAYVVADGLGFANEVRIDAERGFLYVAETYAKSLTRFTLSEDGALGGRTLLANFEPGEFPDGIALDSEGCIWVTCIVANRLLRITPDGERSVILDDSNLAYSDVVEQAYRAGKMQKSHIDQVHSTVLRNISSLAFAGEDLRTVIMGVLVGDRLPTIRTPVAGAPMVHWDW